MHMNDNGGAAPQVVIENIAVETEPVDTAGILEHCEHCDALAAHLALYHPAAEEAARWTSMVEQAELTALREQMTEMQAQLKALQEQTSASASASNPPPASTPEPTSPRPASEIEPAGSSPASSASQAAPEANPPAEAAAGSLSVAVQEAPKVESEKPRRPKGSEKRFRRSLGRVAPR